MCCHSSGSQDYCNVDHEDLNREIFPPVSITKITYQSKLHLRLKGNSQLLEFPERYDFYEALTNLLDSLLTTLPATVNVGMSREKLTHDILQVFNTNCSRELEVELDLFHLVIRDARDVYDLEDKIHFMVEVSQEDLDAFQNRFGRKLKTLVQESLELKRRSVMNHSPEAVERQAVEMLARIRARKPNQY